MENSLNFNLDNMGSADKCSMFKVIECYKNLYVNNLLDCSIFETGFNQNSGYVYIALDNNVTICSFFNNDVEFLVTNFDNGEETFLDYYEDAVSLIGKLDK